MANGEALPAHTDHHAFAFFRADVIGVLRSAPEKMNP
jgi:hypothetical protein